MLCKYETLHLIDSCDVLALAIHTIVHSLSKRYTYNISIISRVILDVGLIYLKSSIERVHVLQTFCKDESLNLIH